MPRSARNATVPVVLLGVRHRERGGRGGAIRGRALPEMSLRARRGVRDALGDDGNGEAWMGEEKGEEESCGGAVRLAW